MTAAHATLLDEWRDPQRDVRIDIDRLTVLRDVSDQYVAPKRSLQTAWTYFRRLGPTGTFRKVVSRLAERQRNRKVAAAGVGWIVEAPAESGFARGEAVIFFAPSVAPDAQRIVVASAFARPAPTAAASSRPASLPLPEAFERYLAWTRFADIPLDDAEIGRALDALAAQTGAPSGPPPASHPVAEQRAVARRAPEKPSVGIFGLGNYAKQLIVPNIPAAFELAGVHEIDPRQLAGWGRKDVALDTCPWPRDDEGYDLWFIAGYHSTHAPIALTALERGGAIAVEKPLATTRADLLALQQALAAKPGAPFFTCFQRRYAVYNDWIMDDLAAEAGDPINYDCIVYEIPLSSLHWYGWPASGSRIVSNGCHWIDHFMFLNGYAEVVSASALPAAHNGCVAMLTLANGAEFVMRLTEVGSPRIGVRDHIEVSRGDRTATIRNAQDYVAEDSIRVRRRRSVNMITAYHHMYREICRRVLAGEPGDALASLGSSFAMLALDEQLSAARREAARPPA